MNLAFCVCAQYYLYKNFYVVEYNHSLLIFMV